MLHEVFFQPPFLPLRAERIPLGPLFCDTGRKDTTRGMITSNFRPSEMLRFSPCQCLLPPRCCPRSTWRSPSRPPSDRLFPARQVSWSPAFASDAPGAFTALRSSLSLARVLRGGAASALDVEGLSCWLTGTPFVTRVQLLAGRSTLDARRVGLARPRPRVESRRIRLYVPRFGGARGGPSENHLRSRSSLRLPYADIALRS